MMLTLCLVVANLIALSLLLSVLVISRRQRRDRAMELTRLRRLAPIFRSDEYEPRLNCLDDDR